MLATHYQFGTQRYLPVSSSRMLGWKVYANMLSWSPVSLAENWNCIIVCTSEAYEEWTKQFMSIIASIKAVAATCYHCDAYFNARHTLRSDYLLPGWIHIYSYSQRKTRQKITPGNAQIPPSVSSMQRPSSTNKQRLQKIAVKLWIIHRNIWRNHKNHLALKFWDRCCKQEQVIGHCCTWWVLPTWELQLV